MVVATIIVDHSIWKKEPSTKKDIIFDSSNVSYSIIRNTNGGGWSSSSLQSVDDEKNVRWIWIIKPWPFSSSSSSSLSCCHNYDYYYHLVSYNDALMFKVWRMMSKIREKIFFSVFTYNIRWNPLLLLLVVVHPFLRANGRCVCVFVCLCKVSLTLFKSNTTKRYNLIFKQKNSHDIRFAFVSSSSSLSSKKDHYFLSVFDIKKM